MKELATKDKKYSQQPGDQGADNVDGGKRPLISIIVPAYNEELNIARLETELNESIGGLPYRFEIILVDNNSADRTGDLIKAICLRDNRWKYIRFSKNFRVESSIAAGYHYAVGEAMIVLYSDLQEPPSVIPAFLAAWENGFDIVHGVHTQRIGEPVWLSFLVKQAYRLVNWCSESPIPENAGDFRLISRRVRDALEQCGDYHRYTRGLIAWLGFPQTTVKYARRPRQAGDSKSDFSVYWSYFSNAITSFSLKPLRLFLLLGVASLLLSGTLLCASYFVRGQEIFFILSILSALQFLLAGVTFLGIGVLGEYCGRTYTEVKGRPLYIIEELVNLDRQMEEGEMEPSMQIKSTPVRHL
jgi:glycosyltransferase involved in cell wall biosynthesis